MSSESIRRKMALMKKDNIVEYLITESGLTQKEFCRTFQVSPTLLSMYKNKTRNVPYVKVIEWANKLGIKL